VLQAAVCDGLTLDTLSFGYDGLGPAEVDVSRGLVFNALVIVDVVVVLDEGADLPFEVASFRAGCGSSGSGASAQSCPGSGDDSHPFTFNSTSVCRRARSCSMPDPKLAS
jgi:hypothetical protein